MTSARAWTWNGANELQLAGSPDGSAGQPRVLAIIRKEKHLDGFAWRLYDGQAKPVLVGYFGDDAYQPYRLTKKGAQIMAQTWVDTGEVT